jgi:hypothetical protein
LGVFQVSREIWKRYGFGQFIFKGCILDFDDLYDIHHCRAQNAHVYNEISFLVAVVAVSSIKRASALCLGHNQHPQYEAKRQSNYQDATTKPRRLSRNLARETLELSALCPALERSAYPVSGAPHARIAPPKAAAVPRDTPMVHITSTHEHCSFLFYTTIYNTQYSF